jgi:hypothetical protein
VAFGIVTNTAIGQEAGPRLLAENVNTRRPRVARSQAYGPRNHPMTPLQTSDPNRKWRRLWRLLHSPLVLLPAVVVCVGAAAADVPEAISHLGWAVGVLVAILLIVGILIAVADLIPHLVRWLCRAQASAVAALNHAGAALKVLSDRIAAIVSDR